jgi:hypothetical protein
MLIDFSECKRNIRYYGGESGAKLGVIYNGANWLLKYPKTTKMLNKPKVSYTTSPLSEFIGSQIYESFEIPVHSTLLGFRDDKLVVACKDFLKRGDSLIEFKNIKNVYNPDIYESGSSGSGTVLSEVLTVLYSDENLITHNAAERFWDMFIIDAFLGNQDRNNTNWGLLVNDESISGLSPVYDNGGAFFDKRDELTFEMRASDEKAIYADAITNVQSVYLTDDEHHINPFSYITETENKDCNDARSRFLSKYKPDKIREIIEAIPYEESGYKIIGRAQSEFYIQMLVVRHKYLAESQT